MMFIKHKENFKMEDIPPSLFDAMGKFVEQGFKSGAVVDTAGQIQDVSSALLINH